MRALRPIAHHLEQYGSFKPCTQRHFLYAGKLWQSTKATQTRNQAPSTSNDNSPLPDLTPKALNLYKVTEPPNNAQLKYSDEYFQKYKPAFLASFPAFRLFPSTSAPEVCFLGRSNVGKSSLINALFRGHKQDVIANVSKKAGRTTTMNAFAVGPSLVGLKTHGVNATGQTVRWEGAPKTWVGRGGLILIDLQGYGEASREEWGKDIIKLLTKRKQLRRAFVLVDIQHGLKENDVQLLQILREHGVPHQIVLTKADKILEARGKRKLEMSEVHRRIDRIGKIQENIWKKLTDKANWDVGSQTALCDILVVSATGDHGIVKRLGVDALRFAILQAAGLDPDMLGRRRAAPVIDEPKSLTDGLKVSDLDSSEMTTRDQPHRVE